MKNKLTNILAPIVLAGGLVNGAVGQDAQEGQEIKQTIGEVQDREDIHLPEYPGPETKFQYRMAVDGIGNDVDLTTQSLLTCNLNDARNSTFKVGVETDADGNNLGFDFDNDKLRANLGYNDNNSGKDQLKGLFTLKFGEDGFAGGSLERLVEGNVASFYGGFKPSDYFHLHGTFNTDGAFNLVTFPKTEGYHLGIGAGMNADGGFTSSASFNNERLWASFRYEPNFSAQISFGDIEPREISKLFMNVTNSGVNELYDGDETFKFTTGDFNHFNVPNFGLAKEPGSLAGNIKFDEDEGDELIGIVGYRVGDLGPFRNLYVSPEARYRFEDDNFTFTTEVGARLSDNFDVKLRANYDEADGASVGLFGRIDL